MFLSCCFFVEWRSTFWRVFCGSDIYMSFKGSIKKESISYQIERYLHQKLLNKKLTEKPVTLTTAEKKDLVIVLPFLGKFSLYLRTHLKNSISKTFRVIFKSSTRISNFSQFEDKIPYCLRSSVVYKFSRGRCNATYYGEGCRHLSVRVGEHLGVSLLTRKKSKTKKSAAVKDQMLFFVHIVSIDDFRIL